MNTLIIVIHVVVCLVLILAVLLQSGKSADLAGAFGGAGSQTAFGSRGSASLLSKVTTICAIVFMFTSLGLWVMSAKGTRSVLSNEKAAPADKPAAVETKKDETQPPAAKTPDAQAQQKQEAPKPEEKK